MMASLPYIVKGERVKISTEYDDSKYCFEVSSNIKNTEKNVADRILLDIRKRYPLMTNHGGHVYYGISPEDRTVCGEILNNVEKKKIRETIANDINFKINSLHRNIDVYFTPVRNDEGRIISNLFVIGIRVFPLEKVVRRGYKRSSGYNPSLVTPPVQSQTISFTHRGKIKKNVLNQVELVKHGKFKVPTKKYWQETVKYEILKDDKSSHNHDSSVAHRITLKHNKLLDYVSDFANHHGGELYYGVNSKGIVCGEAILATEIKEVYEKVKKKIASMVWPEHVHDHKFWTITFLPVKDKNIHQRLYVIQISVKPCRGGVLNARIQENEKTFDRNFLPNDYQTFLKRLEWVESFTIVDTNEECNAGHLEIVCKLGEVPRTAEIVKLFGEEILPFITYKMCLKHKWFETNIFKENLGMYEKFMDELGRLEWVEYFKIVDANNECNEHHLEIVCKFGKVPHTADIVNIFGKEILPFITYQEGLKHKWFETNIFKENAGMYEKFIDELARLEWVESFKIVDANKECNERHLEIVCKFGKVPRTADIVNIFGEEILPFITYQEGLKHKWFEANIFKENAGMSEKFMDELGRLEWVESFKIVDANNECNERHLEIVCKFGKVPRTADIVNIFGKEILPFITYQEGLKHKCFEANIFKENPGKYEKFMDKLARLEWVESFKIVDANNECNERHLEIVPRTADIVNIFGEEILPFITYQEVVKGRPFEVLTTKLSQETVKYKHSKNDKSSNSQNSSVETSGVEKIPSSKWTDARIQEATTKVSDRTAFVDFKGSKREWFETNIFDDNYAMKKEYKKKLASLSWVKDFYIGVASKPEKSWQIYITYAQNNKPSIVDLKIKEIFDLNIASFVDFIQDSSPSKKSLPSPRLCRGPRSGDKVCARPVNNGDGTVSILGFDGKHYAITCYHSCFKTDVPPESILADMHKLLKNDYENENSRGCQGTIRLYTAENPKLDQSITKVGQFKCGVYNNDHDIALIELDSSENCISSVKFLREESIEPKLANKKEVAEMLWEMGKLPVKKFGAITKTTKGELFAIDSAPIFGTTIESGYRIKGIHGQTFATDGDSGSLVCLVYKNESKPFGYLCSEVPQPDNSAVYGCRNLNHSIKELIKRSNLSDIQPCFDDNH